MPTYEYEREDGTRFEIQQRITDDALEVCPTTGQKVKRLVSAAAFHLKGSGWYKTDYAGSNSGSSSSNGSSTSAAPAESKKAESSSDTKKSDTTSSTSSSSAD